MPVLAADGVRRGFFTAWRLVDSPDVLNRPFEQRMTSDVAAAPLAWSMYRKRRVGNGTYPTMHALHLAARRKQSARVDS